MKIDEIKLNALSNYLSDYAMDQLIGGKICNCSCYWAGNTGSSVESNRNANFDQGISSIQGCNSYTAYQHFDGTIEYWDCSSSCNENAQLMVY